MRAAITAYCAAIGSDPLLVQGAGGNVSWKEGGTLWVKASGTWLADARRREIFVPVALAPLRDAMRRGDFDAAPRTLSGSTLRPSIETMLHALLDHKVVMHVHAVEILAHLVRPNFETAIADRIGTATGWVATAYHKPGAELAKAVKAAIASHPSADVVFLQNHGVVAGGRDVADVSRTLRLIVERLANPVRSSTAAPADAAGMEALKALGYRPVPLPDVQKLAADPSYFRQLRQSWALYPDHVVFLGAAPAIFDDAGAFRLFHQRSGQAPELVFVRGAGVFERQPLSAAKYAYLRCYCDVMSRQSEDAELVTLRDSDIGALLNWDAEKFRQATGEEAGRQPEKYRPFPPVPHAANGAAALPPLPRPPSPLRLFLSNAKYRKWAASKLILCFSPILPSRFKQRMQRRIKKHQTGAKMALLEISELTEPAREIFRELSALHASSSQTKRLER